MSASFHKFVGFPIWVATLLAATQCVTRCAAQVELEPGITPPRSVTQCDVAVDGNQGGAKDGYYRLAATAEGSLLAARNRDNAVDVFDLNGHKLLMSLRGHTTWIVDMDFTPDRKYLVTLGEGADGGTIGWNLASGRKQFELTSGGTAQSVGEKGNQLFVASAGELKTVEMPSGKVARIDIWGDRENEPLAVSASGRLIVSHRRITNQTARTQIHDLASDSTVILDGPADLARAVTISPDEEWVAAVYHHSQKVCWWNRNSPREIRFEMGGHDKNLHSVSFSSDSRFLIATSWDGRASVWEVLSGQLVCFLTGHGDKVMASVEIPSNRAILTATAGEAEGLIRRWEIRDVLFAGVSNADSTIENAIELLAVTDLREALPALRLLVTESDESWMDEQAETMNLGASQDDAPALEAIERLNSPDFEERRAAAAELEKHTELLSRRFGGADLQRFSPEQQYWLARILKSRSNETAINYPERLRLVRLILALELRDSDAARKLLGIIGERHPDGRMAREALNALRRMD